MSERFKELVLKTSDPKGPWVRIPLSPPLLYFINSDLEKYPRGRRGSPAKGVGRVERREGSNPSFSAKIDIFRKEDVDFTFSLFILHSSLPSGSILASEQVIVNSEEVMESALRMI